jgi:hypothetical protein
MENLSISEASKRIVGSYPSLDDLCIAWKEMRRSEQMGFIRLWQSEGIPFAFKEYPMIFENIRDYLAKSLSIHPKMITMVGSARIGYSLSSFNFGERFGQQSDLDMLAISGKIFYELCKEFEIWKDEYIKGIVKPSTEKEDNLWPKLIYNELPFNIKKGFIDSHKIYRKYPTTRKIGYLIKELKENIKVTKDAPKVRDASLRIYKDWEAFINQRYIDLEYRLKLCKNALSTT